MEPIMKWLVGILASVYVVFAPIHGVVLVVGLAIAFDTVLGVWRATKVKEPITSRKLARVIRKMLMYESCVLAFFLMDKFILHDIVTNFIEVEYLLTKLLALVLIYIELVSINENIEVITGKNVAKSALEMFKTARKGADEVKKITRIE